MPEFDLKAPDTAQTVRVAVFVPVLGARQGKGPAGVRSAQSQGADLPAASAEGRLQEARGLAEAINLEVVTSGIVTVAKARPATLFGAGKVEELGAILKAEKSDLCIVDHPLSPVQQRNLEREWRVKILDRTSLILEIFGRRARTKEGRLQVELAHLTYQKSRLVRTWTHLERQRGGFGFMGGPGETQIEADRRIIQDRIISIRRELETVTRTRELHRAGRRKVPFPIVALVGYTNAGKSTLFNRLTGADVHAEDLLFATLDPTMRQISLPSGPKIILSDTVGFISDLPTTLIAAFRATLEEVVEADIILHVRDISHDHADRQAQDVYNVLAELGIETNTHDAKIVEVWNKTDLLSDAQREQLQRRSEQSGAATVSVSAKTGDGVERLFSVLTSRVRASEQTITLVIGPEQGSIINWLYENADVLSKDYDPDGMVTLQLRITGPKLGQLETKMGRESFVEAFVGDGRSEAVC